MATQALTNSSPSPSAGARHQLLVEWNDTRRTVAREPSIPELFRAWAERTPDAAALEFGDERLSYRELDRRSDELARQLSALGVGRETLVATCLEPSAARVVALLAILKAGAAYLPLEPADPPERLGFLLADSGAPIVLVRPRNRDRMEALARRADGGTRVVCLGPRATVPGCRPRAHAALREPEASAADQLANVIYTSGSTGRPKGVAVTHRGVVRLVCGTNYIRFEPSDRVAQASNIAFDGSTFEIWGALLNGAALVGIPKLVLLSPVELAHELGTRRISILVVPAPIFHQLARAVPEAAGTLRYVLFGAEPADPRWVREVLEKGRPQHLLNFYGPTETTVAAASYRVAAMPETSVTVPIGRPMAHTTLYVLEHGRRPVAAGEVGELAVGGPRLARGYLRRPALTAEKFIPDPFGADAGGRLYRTGDLVRYRPDGALEFLGRVDHQVKLHGVRIELGEIEATLLRHPALAQAVVLLRQEPSDRRLVAYAVAHNESRPPARELRQFLRASLPEAMIPASFVFLERLPLTPNGKIDRAALPAPENEPAAPEADYAAPRNALEQTLAEMVGELLGRERIGIHDHLIELGGHSLLLAQLVNRIRQTLAIELPLAEVFESPTVAAVAEGLEKAGRGRELVAIPPLRPAAREHRRAGRPLPLSFAQERVWFLNQLAPDNLAYNVQFTLRFRGPLDPHLLERTFTEIVRRHEILRTTFPAEEGRPVQVIHPPPAVRIPLIDLGRLPRAQREAAARRAMAAIIRKPFDLTRLPLARLTLLRFDDREHLLLQMEHHFVHDGWSIALILGEVKAIYPALAAGRSPALPALPVQYADYALWQREWMEGQALDEQLAFWTQRLAGSPRVLELPTDRPRPEVRSFRGDAFTPVVPADLYAELRRFSRRQGMSLFMTMLTAFNALLHRYTGQDDLVLGSGLANRRLRELESMIGMVVNTVLLRSDLARDPSFRELLARTRRMMLEVQRYQDLPFEKLVAALRPERRLDHNPLFQVLFAFHDSPVPDLEFADLSAESRYLHNRSAKGDLTVIGAPRAEQRLGLGGGAAHEEMHFVWEYSTDLFDRTTAERMWRHYLVLLRGAVADPERRLGQLPILRPEESRQLLVEWNATAADYPRDALIHRLFEARVAIAPEAVAVVYGDEVAFGDEDLSYRELNRRANRLAHHLLGLGAGPDVLIGIYLERSASTVEAILAVLKAGGAYLPLDLSYPVERLAFMLADAGAPVLITDAGLAATLPDAVAECGVEVLRLDRDAPAIARSSDRNPRPRAPARADNLAYAVYTSGSTGRPKGVAVNHRAVARLVFHTNYIALGPDDRIAQVSNTSFDAATFELWGALLHGGRLIGIGKRVALVAPALAAAIRERRITAMFLTAALFNQIARQEPATFRGVRHLLVGGEALDPRWVREVLEDGGGRRSPERFLNAYGPTESTTFATWRRVRELAPGARTVPIGGPLANTELYVLDRTLAPVPLGVAGELLIGGDGLARGYLNRPALTAERFVPHPVAGPEQAGERLYRTGDLVRHRTDGGLEFLGRNDFQVKLRGFRIELGEIETALVRHPAVGEAVVLLREHAAADGGAGDRRLVAYVVAERAAAAPDPGELRAYLGERLPSYMVPAAVVCLDSLPLNPNGKVDRAALNRQAVPERDPGGEELFVAAQTPAEEMVAQIWSEVLGIDRVSMRDNFFDLGGHSLLATQVLSRVRWRHGVEVPLEEFFEAATAAGLAAVIERRKERGTEGGDDAAGVILRGEQEAADDLLAQAQALPEEELDALLQSMIAVE